MLKEEKNNNKHEDMTQKAGVTNMKLEELAGAAHAAIVRIPPRKALPGEPECCLPGLGGHCIHEARDLQHLQVDLWVTPLPWREGFEVLFEEKGELLWTLSQ